MGVHVVQVVAGPLLFTKKPDGHCVHCEFVAAVHVSADRQWSTAEQEAHTSAALGPPSIRYVPLAQAPHCEFAGFVQVSGVVTQ